MQERRGHQTETKKGRRIKIGPFLLPKALDQLGYTYLFLMVCKHEAIAIPRPQLEEDLPRQAVFANDSNKTSPNIHTQTRHIPTILPSEASSQYYRAEDFQVRGLTENTTGKKSLIFEFG